jgi:hypothetical protein
MADPAAGNTFINLEAIRDKNLSERETNIVTVLSHEAQAAAHQLDALCPPLDDQDGVESYTWDLWSMMAAVASSPDVTIEVQEHLVGVFGILLQYEKGCAKVNYSKVSTRQLPRLRSMH